MLICTPTDAHMPVVKRALECGKHVMCEKPIAFSIEETKELYELAIAQKVHLLCAFNRRFDPDFMKVKAQVCFHLEL